MYNFVKKFNRRAIHEIFGKGKVGNASSNAILNFTKLNLLQNQMSINSI